MTDVSNYLPRFPAIWPPSNSLRCSTSAVVRIERIVSHGHASPEGFWYDQDRPEWVLLLAARPGCESKAANRSASPGDHLDIPAHARHRVEWTAPDGPTIWLAVHYG